MSSEDPKRPEIPSLVEEWILETQKTWRSLPELQINSNQLKHIGIICDGNRRAAQKRGLPVFWGHKVGIEVIKEASRALREWGLRHLTFWVWSTENWGREEQQITNIMRFGEEELLNGELERDLTKDRVKFTHLGRKDRLSPKLASLITLLEGKTKEFNKYFLNLGIDYGGLDETARAFVKLYQSMLQGHLKPEDLFENPKIISQFLDSGNQPNVDLVIRTGLGEFDLPHTSGFMPLQTIYAEWIFLKDLFPELKPESVVWSVEQFFLTQRRLGK